MTYGPLNQATRANYFERPGDNYRAVGAHWQMYLKLRHKSPPVKGNINKPVKRCKQTFPCVAMVMNGRIIIRSQICIVHCSWAPHHLCGLMLSRSLMPLATMAIRTWFHSRPNWSVGDGNFIMARTEAFPRKNKGQRSGQLSKYKYLISKIFCLGVGLIVSYTCPFSLTWILYKFCMKKNSLLAK